MAELWGGRFEGSNAEIFSKFNESLSFDQRLLPYDIQANVVLAKALFKKKIFTEEELQQILNGLSTILQHQKDSPSFLQESIKAGVEDVHSFIELKLRELIGDLALKLNTGRSRNEQVATSIRLLLKESILNIKDCIKELQYTLIDKAESHLEAILPGYTHLQRAQPITWSHYFHAFFVMFQRDQERLEDAQKRFDECTLGSGALAGNSWMLDRLWIAKELDFSRISLNSLDATSDRDFIIEFLSAVTILAVHLSRLSEDLILYSSKEYGFVTLSDQVSTGSSLMPQKKNPDSLELIRGKTGRLCGHFTAITMVMKGLPSCYNKDMQEDKEALFDSIDTVEICLKVMRVVVKTLQIHTEVSKQACEHGYLNATELADYLCKSGSPFRSAHHLVGQLVQIAAKQNKELHELSLDEFRTVFPSATSDVYACLKTNYALTSKNVPGGTHPEQVKQAIRAAKVLLTSQ